MECERQTRLAFARDGFCVVRGVFDEEEVAVIEADFRARIGGTAGAMQFFDKPPNGTKPTPAHQDGGHW